MDQEADDAKVSKGDPGSWNYLEQFAGVAETVASTTKKLEKTALLGEYLKKLADVDLGRAARYFGAYQIGELHARSWMLIGSPSGTGTPRFAASIVLQRGVGISITRA